MSASPGGVPPSTLSAQAIEEGGRWSVRFKTPRVSLSALIGAPFRHQAVVCDCARWSRARALASCCALRRTTGAAFRVAAEDGSLPGLTRFARTLTGPESGTRSLRLIGLFGPEPGERPRIRVAGRACQGRPLARSAQRQRPPLLLHVGRSPARRVAAARLGTATGLVDVGVQSRPTDSSRRSR